MNATEELLSYVQALTPAQADKVAAYLPFMSATPANEKEKYVFEIILELILTKDIDLLDLILKLLQKSRKGR